MHIARQDGTHRWQVGFTNWPYQTQFSLPETPEKQQNDCGETCVSMILHVAGLHPPITKEQVHRYLVGGTADITTNADLSRALAHFGAIPSHTISPQTQGDLMAALFGYLKERKPVIVCGNYLDATGVYRPEIPHWRVAVHMDEQTVTSADPATGRKLVQTYAVAWAQMALFGGTRLLVVTERSL